VPIRVDLDIPSFVPHPALPLPSDVYSQFINPSLAAYKTPDPTVPYRLRDMFLWNLHETLITPDQFAVTLMNDLDLPNNSGLATQISNQIRTQLEEYAGLALHPLFHSTQSTTEQRNVAKRVKFDNPGEIIANLPLSSQRNDRENALSFFNDSSPRKASSGTASPAHVSEPSTNIIDSGDTYRCIVSLNINLQDRLYTDKFEWSLLHPPGLAEKFAKQTCSDLGLAAQWVPVMAHAIYEAILRLKKEVCENGSFLGVDSDNDALDDQEGGWRFDSEHLADGWEPKTEQLSKEEIEKREGDRERQIRRLRRETARFSSTTNVTGGNQTPTGYSELTEITETPMGRGERSKKRRKFRSTSPSARDGTPGGRGTLDVNATGYGGGGGLNEWSELL
jgi:chromatin structure-remodeling complex subunit SFH1